MTSLLKIEQPEHVQQCDELIWPLVGLSKTQYQKTYLSAYALFSKQYPNAQPLQLSVTALRIRKSHQIPLAAPPGETTRTAEQWSFALFIASFSHSIGFLNDRQESKQFLRRILNEYTLNWLDDDVGKALTDACANIATQNIPLLKIISQAAAEIAFLTADQRNSNPSAKESQLIDQIETALRKKTIKYNTPNAPVNIIHGRIFVLKDYIDRQCDPNTINEFKRIKAMSHAVSGNRKGLTLIGYGWDSGLISELGLDTNFRLIEIY